MMSLLTEEYKKRLLDIVRNIEDLYSKLNTFNTHPSFSELNEKLKIHIEGYNKNILAKKVSKFLRDKQAFHEGRAYKWHQQTKNRTYQHQEIHYDYQSEFSDTSSMASNSSQSLSRGLCAQEKPKDIEKEGALKANPNRARLIAHVKHQQKHRALLPFNLRINLPPYPQALPARIPQFHQT